MRLHQHLGDACCHAERAIHLQGCEAFGKELHVGLLLDIALEDGVSPFSIVQARPEGHLPAP